MNQIVDKNLTKEERSLLLLEIVKELGEVESEGFGRVIIDVQDGHILNWWKITSRTARQFRKKLKEFGKIPL
jgi:hypothetical protein